MWLLVQLWYAKPTPQNMSGVNSRLKTVFAAGMGANWAVCGGSSTAPPSMFTDVSTQHGTSGRTVWLSSWLGSLTLQPWWPAEHTGLS